MDKKPQSPSELARKKREAQALKANLKRRKEAARAVHMAKPVINVKDG